MFNISVVFVIKELLYNCNCIIFGDVDINCVEDDVIENFCV